MPHIFGIESFHPRPEVAIDEQIVILINLDGYPATLEGCGQPLQGRIGGLPDVAYDIGMFKDREVRRVWLEEFGVDEFFRVAGRFAAVTVTSPNDSSTYTHTYDTIASLSTKDFSLVRHSIYLLRENCQVWSL